MPRPPSRVNTQFFNIKLLKPIYPLPAFGKIVYKIHERLSGPPPRAGLFALPATRPLQKFDMKMTCYTDTLCMRRAEGSSYKSHS